MQGSVRLTGLVFRVQGHKQGQNSYRLACARWLRPRKQKRRGMSRCPSQSTGAASSVGNSAEQGRFERQAMYHPEATSGASA